MDIRTRIAELRAYVRTHALSQEKLARDAGISYSWLSKFAQGQVTNPRAESLARLEDYWRQEKADRVA